MKAVGFNQYGKAEVMQQMELPLPEITANQVLVKMKATSINPIDWKLRQGYLQKMLPWSFPIVVGWDAAGVIVKVGSQVKNWQVGDEIFARPETTNRGTYAEYTAIDSRFLAKKPASITFSQAAAVPLAGLTAWQALFVHGRLQNGQKVLIQAGAGGVGSFAIQFAKYCGAQVWTTASPTHEQLLFDLGADHVIDYHQPKQMAMLNNFDLIFDTLGGKSQLESAAWLKPAGKLISIAGQASGIQQLVQQKKASFASIWLKPDGKQLQQVANLMENQKVRPVIGTKLNFSRDNIIKAHKLSETNHVTGKIVIAF